MTDDELIKSVTCETCHRIKARTPSGAACPACGGRMVLMSDQDYKRAITLSKLAERRRWIDSLPQATRIGGHRSSLWRILGRAGVWRYWEPAGQNTQCQNGIVVALHNGRAYKMTTHELSEELKRAVLGE